MDGAGNAALTAARGRLAIRRQLATTPGRLRLAALLLTVGAIAFGAVAVTAAGTRSDAVDDVQSTEDLLVRAVDVSASLSDAHAIAAYGFLVGGTEPAGSRPAYKRQLRRAAAGLAEFAGEIGTARGSRPAVRRITERLTVYSGLIDSARANRLQGFPVGSAYLRRASKVMRLEMLPQARALYEIEANHLIASYRTGVSGSTLFAVILAACGMLALLLATQIYLARATRRVLNPPLVLATVILVGVSAWVVVAFVVEQHNLSRAQSTGSDPVELLTATSILASRAQANESVALSARGGGEGEERLGDIDRGFRALVKPIGDPRAASASRSGGLLEAAIRQTSHSPVAIEAIYGAYRRYRVAHDEVVEQEGEGDFTEAVDIATASTKTASEQLDVVLEREVGVAQERFDAEIARAEARLDGLAGGIPVLTALIGVLALLGVRMRLAEYR